MQLAAVRQLHKPVPSQGPNAATTDTSDRCYTRQEGFGLPLHDSLFPKGSTAGQLSSHSAAGGKQENRFGLKFTEDYRYYMETLNQYYYYDKEVNVKLLQVTNRPRQPGGISKWQVCAAECCRNHQTQAASSKKPPLLPTKHPQNAASLRTAPRICLSIPDVKALCHTELFASLPTETRGLQVGPSSSLARIPHLLGERRECWEDKGIETPDNKKTMNAFLTSNRKASLNTHKQHWRQKGCGGNLHCRSEGAAASTAPGGAVPPRV